MEAVISVETQAAYRNAATLHVEQAVYLWPNVVTKPSFFTHRLEVKQTQI
jgi:hypothetical protein